MIDQETKEKLEAALVQGPLTLGDLRRQYELEPIAVEKIINLHPERFERLTLGIRPAVKLRSELSEKDLKKFALLKIALNGVPLARWQFANKIPIEESRDFANRFSDAVAIVPRKDKKSDKEREIIILRFFESLHAQTPTETPPTVPDAPEGSARILSTNGETEAPINDSDELLADAAKLTLHLQLGWRTDEWLLSMGFTLERVRQIESAYPGLLTIEPSLPQHHFAWIVSLIPVPEPPPQPEVTRKPVEPVAPFPVSDQELEKMRWRPPARNQYGRRGSGLNPASIQHRDRRPLVSLPPDTPTNSTNQL
jgi:hypothetical protein